MPSAAASALSALSVLQDLTGTGKANKGMGKGKDAGGKGKAQAYWKQEVPQHVTNYWDGKPAVGWCQVCSEPHQNPKCKLCRKCKAPVVQTKPALGNATLNTIQNPGAATPTTTPPSGKGQGNGKGKAAAKGKGKGEACEPKPPTEIAISFNKDLCKLLKPLYKSLVAAGRPATDLTNDASEVGEDMEVETDTAKNTVDKRLEVAMNTVAILEAHGAPESVLTAAKNEVTALETEKHNDSKTQPITILQLKDIEVRLEKYESAKYKEIDMQLEGLEQQLLALKEQNLALKKTRDEVRSRFNAGIAQVESAKQYVTALAGSNSEGTTDATADPRTQAFADSMYHTQKNILAESARIVADAGFADISLPPNFLNTVVSLVAGKACAMAVQSRAEIEAMPIGEPTNSKRTWGDMDTGHGGAEGDVSSEDEFDMAFPPQK